MLRKPGNHHGHHHRHNDRHPPFRQGSWVGCHGKMLVFWGGPDRIWMPMLCKWILCMKNCCNYQHPNHQHVSWFHQKQKTKEARKRMRHRNRGGFYPPLPRPPHHPLAATTTTTTVRATTTTVTTRTRAPVGRLGRNQPPHIHRHVPDHLPPGCFGYSRGPN